MDKLAPTSSDPPPAGKPVAVRLRWLLTLGVWLLCAGIVFYFFAGFRFVLLNLLGALAVGAMLRPLLRWAPGPIWLRGSIVGVAFILLVAAILAGLGWLLQSPIKHELALWPQLHASIDALLARWSARFDLSQTLDIETVASRFLAFVFQSGGGTGVISSAADLVTRVLVTLALIFVGMVYFLAEQPSRFIQPLIDPLSASRKVQLRNTFNDLDHSLRFWLLGVIASVFIVGTLSWIGYYLVDLNFALPLAIFAGCAEIVPTAGALTASLLAILVAATQNSTFTLVGVIIVHSITLFLEAYVILPLVTRKAVHLPPAITLFTVVFWAEILGFGGLILAVPLDLVAWILYKNFVLLPHTRPQPPPPPVPTAPPAPPAGPASDP